MKFEIVHTIVIRYKMNRQFIYIYIYIYKSNFIRKKKMSLQKVI